jgi:hypothetical protein
MAVDRTIPKSQAFRPWYRNGWVWFVIAIPGSAILFGIAMLWIASRSVDSLVVDDYYKEGQAINQRLEKDQIAIDYDIGLQTSIRQLESHAQRIDVIFSAKPNVPVPEFIRLRLAHPTLKQLDTQATLHKVGSNRYSTDIPELASGRWYAHLEDDQSVWRVRFTWTVK